MELEQYCEYSKVTRGEKQADLVLKNAQIINVFTGEILPGNVAVTDGMIVGIGDYQGKEEHDLKGKYLALDLLIVIFTWNLPLLHQGSW